MKKKLLAGILIVGIVSFWTWPLQNKKQPTTILNQPVVASESTKTIFVKTNEEPWVKPDTPIILKEDIYLLEENLEALKIQTEVKPSFFKNLDKQDNIFGQSILGGYCLSSHHNARLAADKINNTTIQPQSIFSFNSAAGPFDTSKGYGIGTVIENNRYVPGIGGGVCKTSTALYNAALDAGLEIIESHRHTMPVGYAEPGKDAAVSYGVIDLKICNNRSNPIQILTKTEDGIIYIVFIEHNSNQPQNHEIEIHNINPAISDEISLEESI